MNSKLKPKNRLTQTRFICLGFIMIILLGTLLLMTPIASRSHTVTPFLDSMFTALSATCVTGLVVVDTFTHWTVFGQLVIITLIQIGGLGFITIGVAFPFYYETGLALRQEG